MKNKLRNHTWVKCPYCKKYFWLNNIWLDEKISDKREIKTIRKRMCPNTKEHSKIYRNELFNSISIEKRQEVMDLFKLGICIGEVAWLMNIDSNIISEVICRNLESYSFFQ